MIPTPPDHQDRLQAATTFDRNVVVTAGAGTGKTTLLVERYVNLLMREPDPVQVTELVALTFTNKAANEMKVRVREKLEALAGIADEPPPPTGDDAEPGPAQVLCERYSLKPEEVRERAKDALQHLERAQIGTIHSFAASLLRLYPLETALDPQFREDDGSLLKRHFDASWGRWLDQELSGAGPRTGDWKQVLDRFSLDRLRELALALCPENVDMDGVRDAGAPDDPASLVGGWLRELEDTAADLISRHPEQRKIEKTVGAAQKAVQAARSGGASVDAEESRHLQDSLSAPKGWTPGDAGRARDLVDDARALAQADSDEVARLYELLTPFVQQFREEFARNGLVTFDGLLVRARDLLRGHPRIREELKARFKAILVDEFQDTDPLQYEILLWLCEERSGRAANWRDVRLAPGKLFVVGDPKQSIYGFRGADIEACLKVVKEMIEAQGGVECRLTANFRSDHRILQVVNGLFERLIQEKPGFQPEYIPLQSGFGDAGEAPAKGSPGPVLVRRVVPPEKESLDCTSSDDRDDNQRAAHPLPKADEARLLEAESLARWLAEEVLGRASFHDRDGSRVVVQPGHVAFLMRTLTHVQVYLEALRRHGVGYLVEGEGSFYAAREVVDAVNLFRAIDNPHDRLALVGVLRSPVGGHDDAEIFDLRQKRLLDYRLVERPKQAKLPRSVTDLYQRLLRLHREVRFLEAEKAVERVFRELPLTVLAASGRSGQQAVANLEKVRLAAQEAGAGGSGTFKDVVAELDRRVREKEAEPENVLEEETLDAVRVMSIHRAKGLEFPVVVLVDAQAGIGGRRGPLAEVHQDWGTGLTGVRVDDLWNLPGAFLQAKRRKREAYEKRRLLYVAMTRPRQKLVVSFAPRARRDKDSMAALIDEATGVELAKADRPAVRCGPGVMEVVEVEEDSAAAGDSPSLPAPPPDTTDWSWYEELWRRRQDECEARGRTPLFLTPTRLQAADKAGDGGEAAAARHTSGLERGTALVLGGLAHRVLEHWDFQTCRIREDLDAAIARYATAAPAEQRDTVVRELKAIWATLTESPVYDELRRAVILGREMPFVLPWDGQVMEGVIDVVYESQGRLYVADYKTDQVADDEVARVVHDYRHQARVYTEAVKRGMGREVAAFRLILLRQGRSVDVDLGSLSG